jgi:hypothetical protein
MTAGMPERLPGRLLLLALLMLCVAADCDEEPPPNVVLPSVSITLNAIPASMSSLLVVPPSGFVIKVAWQAGTYPVNPATFVITDDRWGDPPDSQQVFWFQTQANGAVGFAPAALAPGTHTLTAIVGDTELNFSTAEIAFAVRNFKAGAPIGTGQQIWLDLESDRDAVAGPDFPVDLESFGLGSPSAPEVSGWVLEDVTAALLARVEKAYHSSPTNGAPGADPVAVAFSTHDPGAGDVTRICIGGEDPTGGVTIGNILIDPNNANRNSIECSTLPPTGIFPRELLILEAEPAFQSVFDPLRSAVGGTPVGEHPLDSTVLAVGFDPALAAPEELERYTQVQAAITAFADALGSIVAHEAGHALGLVPGGPPGGGLFGGTSGAVANHDVTPTGASPSQNFLMNAGSTFTFARLAGLNGNPLPYFRALDYAYLRDRVVVDPAVTLLAHPPVVASIAPDTIATTGYTQITVDGTGFLPPPVIRCLSASYTYNVINESLVSSSQVTGWINYGQIPPGVYDVELRNPDGQLSVLPAALTIATP